MPGLSTVPPPLTCLFIISSWCSILTTRLYCSDLSVILDCLGHMHRFNFITFALYLLRAHVLRKTWVDFSPRRSDLYRVRKPRATQIMPNFVTEPMFVYRPRTAVGQQPSLVIGRPSGGGAWLRALQGQWTLRGSRHLQLTRHSEMGNNKRQCFAWIQMFVNKTTWRSAVMVYTFLRMTVFVFVGSWVADDDKLTFDL